MNILYARRWILGLALFVTAAATAPMAQQRGTPGAVADIPRLVFEKYTLPNGLDVILSEDKRLPMVAVNLWYHVGPANEVRGLHRVRAPVRAHDVPGLEARAARHAFQVPRSRRRQRHQRHDRFRPHQLLRDAAVESTGARSVAGVRPHGVSARQARRAAARQPAGRRAQRAASERGEPPVRHRRRSRRADAVSAGPSLLRQRHRLPRGHSGGEAGRCETLLQAVLHAQQRQPRDRRATSTRRRPRRWSPSTSGRSSAARRCRRSRRSRPRSRRSGARS